MHAPSAPSTSATSAVAPRVCTCCATSDGLDDREHALHSARASKRVHAAALLVAAVAVVGVFVLQDQILGELRQLCEDLDVQGSSDEGLEALMLVELTAIAAAMSLGTLALVTGLLVRRRQRAVLCALCARSLVWSRRAWTASFLLALCTLALVAVGALLPELFAGPGCTLYFFHEGYGDEITRRRDVASVVFALASAAAALAARGAAVRGRARKVREGLPPRASS